MIKGIRFPTILDKETKQMCHPKGTSPTSISKVMKARKKNKAAAKARRKNRGQ